MSNNKKSGGLFGKGYYIALILCAAAIGISGYVYYRNANQPEEVYQQYESEEQVAVVATEENLPQAEGVAWQQTIGGEAHAR